MTDNQLTKIDKFMTASDKLVYYIREIVGTIPDDIWIQYETSHAELTSELKTVENQKTTDELNNLIS